jgi:sugar (pentulose or hexulose) kinase
MFLGIDCGTSGMRACAIAAGGEVDEFARLEFGTLAEHELAAAWRDALLDLLAGLPAGLRKRLAAIAVDATSATVLACDEALSPTAPPLPYHDSRARAEAEAIARAAGADHPAASASSGLAKVLWLGRRLPAGRRHLFLNQADWLTALLSDLPGVSDCHNALKMGFDPADKKWPAWVANLAEVDSLPSVVPPGSPLGPIARPRARGLGIATDCLIRSGTTDGIAAFIAAGPSLPGEAVTSLGTTLVLKLLSTRRVEDAGSGVYSHWYGDLWLAGGASNAGGGVLHRYFDAAELADLSAGIDAESDSGLDYYPLPDRGERFPVNDPDLPPAWSPGRQSDPGSCTGYSKVWPASRPAATGVLPNWAPTRHGASCPPAAAAPTRRIPACGNACWASRWSGPAMRRPPTVPPCLPCRAPACFLELEMKRPPYSLRSFPPEGGVSSFGTAVRNCHD